MMPPKKQPSTSTEKSGIEEISYASNQLELQVTDGVLSPLFIILISGHGYAGYRKTLGRSLGFEIVSKKPYLEVINLALPHIKEISDEICRGEMGSWSRGMLADKGAFQPKLNICY